MAQKGPKEKLSPREYLDDEEYSVRRKLPRTMPKRKNDLYVTKKTNFAAQLKRCQRLFDESGHSEIFIHGLGGAVNRALTLALRVKEAMNGTVDIAVNTSTVEVVDELEPNNDLVDGDTVSRNNSAVHIKLYQNQIVEETNNSSAVTLDS